MPIQRDPWDLSGRVRRLDDLPVSRGGYSTVYKGEAWISHVDVTPLTVAIKTLMHDFHVEPVAKIYKRLHREAKIWSKLPANDHISRFIGYVLEERHGNIYASLVSEWYPQGHIEKYLSNNPDADRERLSNEISLGLKYLHESQPPIVHGDLKPNNILVNNIGRAVLCDFGMSIALDLNPTGFTTSNIGGATRYLAPELMEGAPRTLEGDIFALGCVFLQIIYKRFPYQDISERAVFSAVEKGVLPYSFPMNDLLLRTRAAPILLRNLIQRCWDHDPTGRPSAADACQVFQTFTDREPLRSMIDPLIDHDGAVALSTVEAMNWRDMAQSLPLNANFGSHVVHNALSLLSDSGISALNPEAAGEALYCLVASSGSHPELDLHRVTILWLLVKAGADPTSCPTPWGENHFDKVLSLPSGDCEPSELRGVPLDEIIRPSDIHLLCIAIYHLNIPLVSALLDAGAPVSSTDCNPLVIAAARPNSGPLVQFLLSRGASVNGVIQWWDVSLQPAVTAIVVAAFSNNLQAVRALLAAGSVTNVNSCHRQASPLYWATFRNNLEMVCLLLQYDADINSGGHHNRSVPLHMALQGGHSAIVEVFLNAGARVTSHTLFFVTNSFHLNLLMMNNPSLDLEYMDIYGFTPLHAAAEVQCCAVVVGLLHHGANATKCTRDNSTVLHSLCRGTRSARQPCTTEHLIITIHLLISYGVSVDATNSSGQTAFDCLQESGQHLSEAVIDLLRPKRLTYTAGFAPYSGQ